MEKKHLIILKNSLIICSIAKIFNQDAFMKPEASRIILAGVFPLFVLFILYVMCIIEITTDWELHQLGVYPMRAKGLLGIFTHPLVHSGFKHLLSNSLSLFFLSWCLFYFYRDLAYLIYLCLWIGSGVFTFFIGKSGWHIGASGVIYALAFFLFFSGLLRRHRPLVAISLLVTFLYGSLVWQMFPHFTKDNVSWEGHLSGAITGLMCALVFLNYGPQKPEPLEEEEDEIEDGQREDSPDMSSVEDTENPSLRSLPDDESQPL